LRRRFVTFSPPFKDSVPESSTGVVKWNKEGGRGKEKGKGKSSLREHQSEKKHGKD
jgi:hypothetical protein